MLSVVWLIRARDCLKRKEMLLAFLMSQSCFIPALGR